MTEEEAKRLPVEPRSTPDAPSEYSVAPDPEVLGLERYQHLLKRIGSTKESHGYKVIVPCCRCSNCIIVREMRMGQIINTGFGCANLRITCDPYGTCDAGYTSKRGPMVLVRKLEAKDKATDFKNLPGEVWGVEEPPKEVPKAVLSGKVGKEVPRNLNS